MGRIYTKKKQQKIIIIKNKTPSVSYSLGGVMLLNNMQLYLHGRIYAKVEKNIYLIISL